MRESFDNYVKRNWIASTPQDCVFYAKEDSDCIEKNFTYHQMCRSCQLYMLLSMQYERDVEGILPTRSVG